MSEKYEGSVDNVIASTKYMSGVYGARCTTELKKVVRFDWQKPDDVHVFGMTVEEQGRIDRLLDSEADINVFAPLITQGFTKDDCFEVFSKSGIKRPIMYDLGFSNNNCKGCLKAGGAGYWNLTRKHFPDVFNIRSKQEEILGVALVKIAGNVILNNHIESFLSIANDILSGKLKALKVDGANKPLLKKGKPVDCTLLPKHLLEGVSEYTNYDGRRLL